MNRVNKMKKGALRFRTAFYILSIQTYVKGDGDVSDDETNGSRAAECGIAAQTGASYEAAFPRAVSHIRSVFVPIDASYFVLFCNLQISAHAGTGDGI